MLVRRYLLLRCCNDEVILRPHIPPFGGVGGHNTPNIYISGITILVHNHMYIGKLLSRNTKPIGKKINPLTAMTRGQQDTASAQ